MRTSVVVLLTSTLALASCGSAFNPLNWFGRNAPEPSTEATEDVNPLIPRNRGVRLRLGTNAPDRDVDTTTPITQVTNVRIERVPGGAIIRATGRDPGQGAFNASLVPVNDDEVAEDGVLTYRFMRDTARLRARGNESTLDVVVARHVTDQTLASATTIRVEGAQNALQVRR